MIYVIIAWYGDGSGEPIVLFATDEKEFAEQQIEMIEKTQPMMRVKLFSPTHTYPTMSPEDNTQ